MATINDQLMKSISDGDWRTSTELVLKGANVNYVDINDESIISNLFYNYNNSMVCDYHKCFLLLLEYGLDVNHNQDVNDPHTILPLALRTKHSCPWLLKEILYRYNHNNLGNDLQYFLEGCDSFYPLSKFDKNIELLCDVLYPILHCDITKELLVRILGWSKDN